MWIFNRGNMIATNYLLLIADGDNAADSLAPETQMCDQRFGSVDETWRSEWFMTNISRTWQHQHELLFGPHELVTLWRQCPLMVIKLRVKVLSATINVQSWWVDSPVCFLLLGPSCCRRGAPGLTDETMKPLSLCLCFQPNWNMSAENMESLLALCEKSCRCCYRTRRGDEGNTTGFLFDNHTLCSVH